MLVPAAAWRPREGLMPGEVKNASEAAGDAYRQTNPLGHPDVLSREENVIDDVRYDQYER